MLQFLINQVCTRFSLVTTSNIKHAGVLFVCFYLLQHTHTEQGSSSSDTSLGVWQFDSVLTQTARSQHRPHRWRAQSHKTTCTSDAHYTCKVATCTSDQPAKNRGLLDILLWFDNLLEWPTELRKALSFLLPVYYKGLQLRNRQIDEIHRAR